jgi:hypothetical protein
MNPFMAAAIVNTGLVLLTAFAIWTTGDPWCALILLFMHRAKSNNDKEGDVNND